MTRYYEVCSTRVNPKTLEMGDSWDTYAGFYKDEATKAFEEAVIAYTKATPYDRLRNKIEIRLYELPDEITPQSDKFDIIDALCDCGWYDSVEFYEPAQISYDVVQDIIYPRF